MRLMMVGSINSNLEILIFIGKTGLVKENLFF
jgi:hypothetical protein